MSTQQVTNDLVKQINNRVYDFIVVNLANADMLGHTGNLEATIKGIQTIDFCLGTITKAVLSAGGGLIITADHGNAEEMINARTGAIDTEHNPNPAPCIFVFHQLRGFNIQLPQGILADVAPTILGILKIPKPPQMSGRNLLE
jgi:2,3-bisphosphoglycerate-independent phosphoglycerate mutase